MWRWIDLSFFFNDTATTEIYTLSLHDALPIYGVWSDTRCQSSIVRSMPNARAMAIECSTALVDPPSTIVIRIALVKLWRRSEEHTSELQSRQYLVCRLLLEKKKELNNQHNESP